MFCNKKVFGKFLLFSIILLLSSFCCNAIFVSATIPKQAVAPSLERRADVEIQQRTIINNLRRIENKLDR